MEVVRNNVSLHVYSILEGYPKLGLYNRASHILNVTDVLRRKSAEAVERFVE
jgi:hypothetical protein